MAPRAASGRRRCSSKRSTGRSMRSSVIAALVLIVSIGVAAQGQAQGQAQGPPQGPPPGGRGGRGAQPPRSPRAAAPVDFTGYWVSVVTEDWRWRMVTPAKGDFAGVPLNAAARK